MPTARRDRKRAAAAGVMGLTLLLAPLLLLRNPTAPHGGTVLATAGPVDTDVVARRFAPRTARSSHTGRIAAQAVLAAAAEPAAAPEPERDAPPTTAVRRLAAASVTTASKPTTPTPTTTTTRPRPRPTTTTAPAPTTTAAPAHSETGEASWYSGPDGECAHNSAPLGSVIRVTNLDNGQSTTCRVAGRGPYGGGRVVDLSKSTFARVASVDAGVFHARVDW